MASPQAYCPRRLEGRGVVGLLYQPEWLYRFVHAAYPNGLLRLVSEGVVSRNSLAASQVFAAGLSLVGNRFAGTGWRFVLPAGPDLWNVQVRMSLRCQISRCGRCSRVRIETAFLGK